MPGKVLHGLTFQAGLRSRPRALPWADLFRPFRPFSLPSPVLPSAFFFYPCNRCNPWSFSLAAHWQIAHIGGAAGFDGHVFAVFALGTEAITDFIVIDHQLMHARGRILD